MQTFKDLLHQECLCGHEHGDHYFRVVSKVACHLCDCAGYQPADPPPRCDTTGLPRVADRCRDPFRERERATGLYWNIVCAGPFPGKRDELCNVLPYYPA